MKKIKKMVVKVNQRKKPLVSVSGGAAFWVHQGPVLRNLSELAKFLAIITEEQFAYHTRRAGNDFAKWVETVLQDKTAAAALRRAKTRTAAAVACRRTLARYDA